jgi:hypothetical protein
LKKITNIITNISRELKMMKSSLKKQGNEHAVKLRKLWTVYNVMDRVESSNRNFTTITSTGAEVETQEAKDTRSEPKKQVNLQD